MKSILLTTTAIVAFAGAAAAEGHTGVSFSGSTTLGYNDDSNSPTAPAVVGDYQGFYWEGNLAVSMSTELDNGLIAGAQFDADFVTVDDTAPPAATLGQDLVSGGFVLSLESENAGLFFGDTEFAAITHWSSAGDMEFDGFSEVDGEAVIRGDVSVAGVDASLSYVLADTARTVIGDIAAADDVDQLSIGASADFGMFNVAIAYQEASKAGVYTANGDFNVNELFGISVGAAVAGADITVAYASDETTNENSTGIKVAYPFGPVTGTVYYVSEDDLTSTEDNYGINVAYSDGPIAVALDYQNDQGVDKVGLDGSYDIGNGLTVLAGVYDQSSDATVANNGTDYYVAGTYDMGGGAELLVSYAEAEVLANINDDEIGAPDYQVGTTVAVSFSF